MKIFGFEIKREEEDKDNREIPSFAEPLNDEGAINVGSALGGAYGILLDMDNNVRSESELITRYRAMTMSPEIQIAVDEIVNEVVTVDSNDGVVDIVLDDLEASDKVKKRISEEFEEVLRLLDFSNSAYDIVSRYYVDGRLNYHVIIDPENLKRGIVELRYLDPRKVRLIRELDDMQQDPRTGAVLKTVKNEFYMYSDTGFGTTPSNQMNGLGNQAMNGFRISKDAILRITSGIMNETNTLVLSHLHKAFKPLNQLRMLEDATVIYTLTRAPERRIFYIDVGNLPKAKAEQYLQDMMARHKNRISYDSATGEVSDARKMMTMTEDYWFPRREGSRSTEVEPLPAGQGLMDNENLTYFQRRLYKSLHVPVSRMEPETMYAIGRVSEISRDEVKFSKFIKRLRNRFSVLFDGCLERQLVLKGIISPEEWVEIKNKIRYDFKRDNYFEELKETEILREKINTLRDVDDHVGKYFSRAWVVRKVLFMSEEEHKEIKKEIEQEKAEGLYDDTDDADAGAGGGFDDGGMGMGGGGFGAPAAPPGPPQGQPPQGEQPEQEAEESLEVINNLKKRQKLTGDSDK